MPRITGRTRVCAAVAGLLVVASSCSYAEEVAKAGTSAPADLLVEAELPPDLDTVEVGGAIEEREDEAEVAVSSAAITPALSGSDSADEPQRLAIVNVPLGLNLRTGPGLGYDVIVGITKDRIVTATGNTDGDWTEVTIDGDSGWMSSLFLEPTNAEDPGAG